jgi:aromatic-L-amino-acid/L-tryptophan decarboxylase
MDNVGAMFGTGAFRGEIETAEPGASRGRTAGLDRDPLALTPAQMRALGYSTVDLIVDQLVDPDTVAMRRARPSDLNDRIDAAVPERPRLWGDLLGELNAGVLQPMSRLAHPRYFAFIPASSTFPGALGDLIASALDIDVGSWSSAAGPSHLESIVLDWFKQWIGYPDDADGVLVSGGSAANMTGLACARETLVGAGSADAVVYASEQTHSSVVRAARLLGFSPERIRSISTDASHQMRLDTLSRAIAEDRRAGLRPLIVAANAGATNTGVIDPLTEIAAVCREHGLWLHVDAAYGGFAALTERGASLLRGLELADSVTLDPHKWLYQPIECGCVLVRRSGLLERAFAIAPDYLGDYRGGEIDFCDRGLQLTRGARALKVWLSLSYFGVDAFRAAIDRSLELARAAQRQIESEPTLELLSPAVLGVVCFRRHPRDVDDEAALERLNAALVARFESSGRGLVSSTRLDGRYAIRMCVMNHTSGPNDVAQTLQWFARARVSDTTAS